MKLTKQGRKLIISKIKDGEYDNKCGIYKLNFDPCVIRMIWYKAGKRYTIILTLAGVKGESIDLPVGWWDKWLIKRALKKYCKGDW